MEERRNGTSALLFILIALYVLSPIDLLPGCPLDDIAAIILGLNSRHSSGS